MFSYSRVLIDDEEDAAGARLLADAPIGPVAPTVVTSTSALPSRSQQAVQQRRPPPGAAPTAPAHSASTGNLIDLGEEADARSHSTAKRDSKSRGRGGPQQVELVALAPFDPFELLVQQTAGAPPPPPYMGSGARGSLDGPGGGQGSAPQHPLDFGFPRDPHPDHDPHRQRAASHAAASSSAAAAAAGGAPILDHESFSDLLLRSHLNPDPAAGPGGGPGPAGGGQQQPQWNSFSLPPSGPGGAGGGASSQSFPARPHPAAHAHSASSSCIDDLLAAQRTRREAEHAAHHAQQPQQQQQQHPVFDPFAEQRAAAHAAGAAGAAAAAAAAPGEPAGAEYGGGGGGGEGFTRADRELLLYAIPLFKERLVFLPVVNWKDEDDTSTVLGKVSAGVSSVQAGLSSMWHGLKDKGSMGARIYKAGQAIMENMNAEERLMRNIPRKANKLVVHHPACIPPDEVQDQLTQLTSTFCYKSAGKAAVAGVMLPVAVGLEMIAVPGIGWYTAYMLFKSTSAAAGGSRLNNYLKSDKSEVRVCYSPAPKMDLYILKARLSPDGVLGCEDIEDLAHDILEPGLAHPLLELRARHLKKTQTMNADYALLPMSAPDTDEQFGSAPAKKKN